MDRGDLVNEGWAGKLRPGRIAERGYATLLSPMRICIVYDCLFPHTVGGAERWYRNLAERLAADGHEVSYLTLRQWDRGENPALPGVRVVVAAPRMALYTASGRRRILPPVIFGAGVFWYLLRRGRAFDVVHTASFPYFSLLAAALVRPLRGFSLVVDWHEAWTLAYWRRYLGRWGGLIGWGVQRLCLRIPQRAFCFSRLHARRIRDEGYSGTVTVLEGEYAGPLEPRQSLRVDPMVMFAGRFIPEKRVGALIPAVLRARETVPDLYAELLGDGPERAAVRAAVAAAEMESVIRVPGFVPTEEVEGAFARALCLALPSSREGYGQVVIEAASYGTPSIVVAGADNAAVEHIEEGINGFVAPSPDAEDLAEAIVRVQRGGQELRRSTAEWFAANSHRLSVTHSLQVVASAYAGGNGDVPSARTH